VEAAVRVLAEGVAASATTTATAQRVHQLKTWPVPFQAILDGNKTHEFRVDDRPWDTGHVLHLREWEPQTKTYTDREAFVLVTHITRSGWHGIPAGHCVMSVRLMPPTTTATEPPLPGELEARVDDLNDRVWKLDELNGETSEPAQFQRREPVDPTPQPGGWIARMEARVAALEAAREPKPEAQEPKRTWSLPSYSQAAHLGPCQRMGMGSVCHGVARTIANGLDVYCEAHRHGGYLASSDPRDEAEARKLGVWGGEP
jgi:hypothetical protein